MFFFIVISAYEIRIYSFCDSEIPILLKIESL